MEADDRDRQKEKEEIEELRNKLTEEGHSDVEGEVARVNSYVEQLLMIIRKAHTGILFCNGLSTTTDVIFM